MTGIANRFSLVMGKELAENPSSGNLDPLWQQYGHLASI